VGCGLSYRDVVISEAVDYAMPGNGSLTRKSKVLSMAKTLSRLIPNTDCRLSLVIRHRQGEKAIRPFL